MTQPGKRALTIFLCPVLFLFSLGLLIYSQRLLSLLLLALVVVSFFCFLRSGKTSLMRLAWVVFVISTFLPVDISFRNYPGPPRFVPLVMGYPTNETVERARRGEVMLGGCMVRGNEPEWVWVW